MVFHHAIVHWGFRFYRNAPVQHILPQHIQPTPLQSPCPPPLPFSTPLPPTTPPSLTLCPSVQRVYAYFRGNGSLDKMRQEAALSAITGGTPQV